LTAINWPYQAGPGKQLFAPQQTRADRRRARGWQCAAVHF
jgi:hypothetical protein